MKTIKQIADELNTTPQNIYNHLKRNNISRASLNYKKQGKQVFYDEDAETIIKGMFETPVNRDNENKGNNETFETLNAEIERLKGELEAVREAEAAAQEEIARLRQLEEEHRHQITGLIDAEKNRTELAKFEAAKMLAAPVEEPTQSEQPATLKQRLRYLFKGK